MKRKIITLLLITFLTSIINGQTDKGTIYIGGNSNLGLSFQNSSDNSGEGFSIEKNINSFQLSTRVGYFIIDNLVAGIGFSLNSSKEVTETIIENRFSIIQTEVIEEKETNNALVFVKYYFLKNNFKPYLNTSFGYGNTKDITLNKETNRQFLDGFVASTSFFQSEFGGDYSTNILNFGVGAAYFFTDYLNVELEVNYNSTTIKSINDTTLKGINTSFGLSLLL